MNHDQIEDIYALSPAQQGMLFESLLAPESGVYVNQKTCELRGELRIPAFDSAWQKVLERYAVLRTSFLWEELDEPVQIVHRKLTVMLEQHDWQGRCSADQKAAFAQYLNADRRRGFDLSTAPLIRLTLFQTAAGAYRFLWTTHHLLLDGWSNQLLLKELLAIYHANCRGEELHLPPIRPYRDYIAWLQAQDLSKAESYWRAEMKSFSTPTRLATARPPAGADGAPPAYKEITATIPEPVTQALASFARQQQLTLNACVQGAWAILLSHYSSQTDVVFGVTVSGRSADLAGLESMLGVFINTLPARLNLAGEQSLLPWLKMVQEKQSERSQFEYSPLVEVQGWSEVPRGKPLFETNLVFENYPVYAKPTPPDATAGDKQPRLGVADVQYIERSSYPLTAVVTPNEGLTLTFQFDSSQYSEAIIKRMLAHWRTLLEAILADPHQRLSSLPRMTDAERHRLFFDCNDTWQDYPRDHCIQELFEQQSARRPDFTALTFGRQRLSYGELNYRANQVAHFLRSKGVKAETLVGICVERSPEMVIGLLGILKAGGAYLPIDPANPLERIAGMLKDARVPLILTERRRAERLPEDSIRQLCLDTDGPEIQRQSGANPTAITTPDNLAYVIFTSGSTGRPKGVMIAHRGVVNYLSWAKVAYRMDQAEGTLVHSPLSFDLTVTALLGPLLAGNTAKLVKESEAISETIQTLSSGKVYSLVKMTPSHVELISEPLAQAEATAATQVYVIGGEALRWETVRKLRRVSPTARIINEYGPTETVVGSSVFEAGEAEATGDVPIGKPIANTQLYIVDSCLQLAPVGVGGELCIAGEGLGRGYLNEPQQTAEKFVANPYSGRAAARMYRTGDLCRYREDGEIEFLGRIDQQVKIRGYRVELGEIEAALMNLASVKEAVVEIIEEGTVDKRLVAYVVARAADTFAIKDLQAALRKQLPEYMLPSAFVQMAALPLSLNGKVDRKRLPLPDSQRPEQREEYVAARTETERTLARIWTNVLRLDKVGIYDNFFDLGGHSLLVNQVVSRIREAFELGLPLRRVFETPVLVDLAATIDEALRAARPEIEKLAELLGKVEELSDEEIAALLEEQGMMVNNEESI